MSDPKQSSGSSFLRVLSGGVVGFILGAFVRYVVGLGPSQKKPEEPLAGSRLVPVVVAAQDIPEGTAVTFDHLQQRMAPEQFVTNSVVKPHSASYIVNVRLLVPVQAGDMLLWSQFEAKPEKSSEPAPVGGTQVK
jgi:pilus assembly protein CpaB